MIARCPIDDHGIVHSKLRNYCEWCAPQLLWGLTSIVFLTEQALQLFYLFSG